MLNILLFIVLIICLITDLKNRKIYNKIIFPALLLALLFNTILYGWSGLTTSFLGFLAGLGILLIPYLMGGMGAGDVKLLAVIGAVKGAPFVLATAIFMALIGGLVGLGMLLFRKGLFQRIKSLFQFLCGMRYGMKLTDSFSKSNLKRTFPYGIAIVGGSFAAFFFSGGLLLW